MALVPMTPAGPITITPAADVPSGSPEAYEPSPAEWRRLGEALRAPFAPAEVDWMPGGRPYDQKGRTMCQVIPYVNRALIQDRLDTVLGPGMWDFDWVLVQQSAAGRLESVKGMLRVYGRLYSDIGTASNIEGDKGTVTDALKRVATYLGVARYLAHAGHLLVPVDKTGEQGRGVRIPASSHELLRDFLRRWDGRPGASAEDAWTAAKLAWAAKQPQGQSQGQGQRKPAN